MISIEKALDIFCLMVWICWLIHGIYCCVKKVDFNQTDIKIVHIGAIIICVCHFLSRVLT